MSLSRLTRLKRSGSLSNLTFDVVTLDLQMPRLGDPGLYEQMLGNRPEIAHRFVFLAGDDARRVSCGFLSRARQPTLPTPCQIADLVAAVDEIAAQ